MRSPKARPWNVVGYYAPFFLVFLCAIWTRVAGVKGIDDLIACISLLTLAGTAVFWDHSLRWEAQKEWASNEMNGLYFLWWIVISTLVYAPFLAGIRCVHKSPEYKGQVLSAIIWVILIVMGIDRLTVPKRPHDDNPH